MTDDNLPDVAYLLAQLRGPIFDAVPDDNDMQNTLSVAAALLESLSARVTQAADESPEMKFIREIHAAAVHTTMSHNQMLDLAGFYGRLASAEAERDELRGRVVSSPGTGNEAE